MRRVGCILFLILLFSAPHLRADELPPNLRNLPPCTVDEIPDDEINIMVMQTIFRFKQGRLTDIFVHNIQMFDRNPPVGGSTLAFSEAGDFQGEVYLPILPGPSSSYKTRKGRVKGQATLKDGILNFYAKAHAEGTFDADDLASVPAPHAVVDQEVTITASARRATIEGRDSEDCYLIGTQTVTVQEQQYKRSENCLEKKPAQTETYPYYDRIGPVVKKQGTETPPADQKAENGQGFTGRYLKISGEEDPRLYNRLSDVDRFMAQLESTLAGRNFGLAETQTEQLCQMIHDLKQEGPVKVTVLSCPTDKAMENIRTLNRAIDEMKLRFRDAQERKAVVMEELERLRTSFAANVVKGMMKSALTWTNTIQTHPLDGLSGYSGLTEKLSLPATFLGWCQTAMEDATVLSDQVNTIRQLEIFQNLLDQYGDRIIEQRREAILQYKREGENRVSAMDKKLKQAVDAL